MDIYDRDEDRSGVDDFANLGFPGLWLKGGEDPCGAAEPMDPVGTRRYLHDQIEWVLLPSTLLPRCFGDVGKLLGSGKVDWEQPIPSDGALYRLPVGPAGGEPDRDSGLSDGGGSESSVPVTGEPVESTIQETCGRMESLRLQKARNRRCSPVRPHRQTSAAQTVKGDGSRATFWMRLHGSRVTVGPRRIDCVAIAMALSTTHHRRPADFEVDSGSVPEEYGIPASSSAWAARSAITQGSARSSKGARYRPRRMAADPVVVGCIPARVVIDAER